MIRIFDVCLNPDDIICHCDVDFLFFPLRKNILGYKKESETQYHIYFQLLPLPNSYPVSPDDNENADLSHSSKMVSLFRDGMPSLSSSYNISGLVPAC